MEVPDRGNMVIKFSLKGMDAFVIDRWCETMQMTPQTLMKQIVHEWVEAQGYSDHGFSHKQENQAGKIRSGIVDL